MTFNFIEYVKSSSRVSFQGPTIIHVDDFGDGFVIEKNTKKLGLNINKFDHESQSALLFSDIATAP